jgi:hypothetical protein
VISPKSTSREGVAEGVLFTSTLVQAPTATRLDTSAFALIEKPLVELVGGPYFAGQPEISNDILDSLLLLQVETGYSIATLRVAG